MTSSADVERVLEHIHRSSDLVFFFDRLTSPTWLKPLYEKGLLSEPPDPEVEGNYVRYPKWAASRYLARIADQAPQQVFDIIMDMEDTANPRVHEDLVTAALAMPPDLARQLVPKVKSWLEGQHLLLLPDRISDLIIYLSNADAIDDALSLTTALLKIEQSRSDDLTDFDTRLDDYEFDQVVRKLWEPLARAGQVRAFVTFVQIVDQACAADADSDVDDEPVDDGSTVWRPNLANRDGGVTRFMSSLNVLVDAVIDIAGTLLASQQLNQAIGILTDARALVLRRIALYLLSEHPNTASSALISRNVLRRSVLDDTRLENEYLSALHAVRSRLQPNELMQIMVWIRTGPAAESLRKRLAESWPEFLARWQARRIAALADTVPLVDKGWANRMVERFDAADLKPAPVYSTEMSIGPTSPKDVAELSALSVRALVEYLRVWQPTEHWAAPSREGLGHVLTSSVAERALEISISATAFVGLDPVYVRSILAGLREAVRKNQHIHWDSVLELGEWVLSQEPSSVDLYSDVDDRDPGWNWTWTELARLLSAGLTHDKSGLQTSSAERIERALLRLIEHPEPSLEHEARYGGSNMDPVTLSINTARGEALHALVQYAGWLKKATGAHEFNPSVRRALEAHVDLVQEPSLAVHSVYGHWLGLLYWLDAQWTERALAKIFPLEDEHHAYWSAAWSAFIGFNRPSETWHRLLRRHYRLAIERLATFRADDGLGGRRDMGSRLAAHLLSYYLWGLESTPDSDLLAAFFGTRGETRSELIALAGRVLRDPSNELSADQIDMLKALWTARRVAASRTHIDADMRDELSKFAWWSGARQLDVTWWLGEVRWLVHDVRSVNPAFLVIKALPGAARQSPALSIDVLAGMVRFLNEPWLIQGHADEAREVLELGVDSNDAHVVDSAVRLIHELGARDIADFSALLSR